MLYGQPFDNTPALIDLLVKNRPAQEHPFFFLISGGVGTKKPVMRRLLESEEVKLITPDMVVIEPRTFTDHIPEMWKDKHIQHPEKLPEHIEGYFATTREIITCAIERRCSIVLVDHGENLPFIKDLVSSTREAGYETCQMLMTCTRPEYEKITKKRETDLDINRSSDPERFLMQHYYIRAHQGALVRLFDYTDMMFMEKPEAPVIARWTRDGGYNIIIDGEAYGIVKAENWEIEYPISKPEILPGGDSPSGAGGVGGGEAGGETPTRETFAAKLEGLDGRLQDLFEEQKAKDAEARRDRRL